MDDDGSQRNFPLREWNRPCAWTPTGLGRAQGPAPTRAWGVAEARRSIERLIRRQTPARRYPRRGRACRRRLYEPGLCGRLRQAAVPCQAAEAAVWQQFPSTYRSRQERIYVAFVMDVFARRIMGWRVSPSAPTLSSIRWSKALRERRPTNHSSLIHHATRGHRAIDQHLT